MMSNDGSEIQNVDLSYIHSVVQCLPLFIQGRKLLAATGGKAAKAWYLVGF